MTAAGFASESFGAGASVMARNRPRPPTAHPSAEEFAIWKENPVTAWVLESYRRIADGQRDDWLKASWADAEPDRDYLIRKRAMALTFGDVADPAYEDVLAFYEPLKGDVDG